MKPHVLVLGAGVVGLCTALDLLERGFGVTVLDREGPERQSASHGNAGMIVPSTVSHPLPASRKRPMSVSDGYRKRCPA